MVVKISYETEQLIEELYATQDFSTIEIAKKANVVPSTVYGYTKLRERINPETGKPFKSQNEYQHYLATSLRINPETGNPFESKSQYQDFMVRQMINPLTGKPFGSQNEYQRYRAEERQKRPENQGLSDFIKARLRELGKNKSWLAKQIGLTYRTVSLYANGTSIPKDDLLERLFYSLDVPYKTLDDLLA